VTPGESSYTARTRSLLSRHGLEAGDALPPLIGWDRLTADQQADEEAGALAGAAGWCEDHQPEEAGQIAYLYHWRFDRGEEFGLYWHGADADAKAAEHAGDGLSEVLSMEILSHPQTGPVPRLEGDNVVYDRRYRRP
jgi:hypothetical protein